MANERACVIIEGIVQGVGYRYFALARAKVLNLSGYVMNLKNRRKVKLEIEGERKHIDDFIKELRNGPSGSYVEDLKIEWSECLNEYRGFSIRF